MKRTRLIVCLTAVGVGVALAVPQANAGISFSFGAHINSVADFHAPLADLGTWMNIGPYGQCWRPNGVAPDWRPYCNGSWQYTDDGWYWQSDEAWAPECYHYGSWVDDPSAGWVWIPGTEWAPAWVTWRYSDNYIGWAPCGPNESVAPAAQFCFVDAHNFGGPIRRDNLIINNRNVIDRTRVVKDFRRESHDINGVKTTVFANRGPDIRTIQRATGRQFQARPIGEVVQNSRRNERTARQPDRTRAEAQPQQPGRRIINEPAGAQTPTEPRRDQPSAERRDQATRLQQENAAQHASRPDEPANRALREPAARQSETRSVGSAPRVTESRTAPTIREPAGAERVAPERATPERQSPTIREPAGAERATPERETARPAQRPVERQPAARPTEAAPRREAAPARSAPPEQKKQPQQQQ